VAVTELFPDIASAEREVYARRVDGILVIPQYFERDLLHGRPSPVALYADASYFLIYQRVSGAVAAVARTLGAEIETARLIAIGVDPAIAAAAPDPMPLTAVPIFNPEAGYATYVLPAAFVLILQQMLLMGVGLLGTLPGADPADGGTRGLTPATIIAGKLLAYLALEAVILPIYLIVLPYLYGLPRLGETLPILIFAVPFVLAVAGLGFVVAGIFRRPIRVALILAALGLPLFMVAGFSWPSEAIPPAIRMVSYLVPSTSAITGFVKLSQLGAPLAAANSELLTLCALAVFYNLIAVLLMARKTRAIDPTVSESALIETGHSTQ
jgi:ABC-2 type transport system permease protein